MQAIKSSISRDDYLLLDEAATEKHEFYRGETNLQKLIYLLNYISSNV